MTRLIDEKDFEIKSSECAVRREGKIALIGVTITEINENSQMYEGMKRFHAVSAGKCTRVRLTLDLYFLYCKLMTISSYWM